MRAALPAATDLVIVLPHLGQGGAQKVALLAAEHFQARGLRVVLVTLLPDKALAHALPDALTWIDLGREVAATWRNRALWARGGRFLRGWAHRLLAWMLLALAWPLIRRLRPPRQTPLVHWLVSGVSGPQATCLLALFRSAPPSRVLSLLTRTNLLCCAALWDLPGHLVVSERNDPQLQIQPFPWPRLQGWLWRRADAITANTSGVQAGLRRLHPDRSSAIRLLPNPLPRPTSQPHTAPGQGAEPAPGLLAVCRLVPQKGIDLLIRAYSQLEPSLRRRWPLRIAGDGPERATLEQLAHASGSAADIAFLGFVSDPRPLYRPGDVFVLPSRFEGMPNALLEAMGQGLAVIVSDASPGPLEVVEDGVTGLVVPRGEVEALAAAIQRLIGDPELRHRLGEQAAVRMAAHDWPQLEPLWRATLDLGPASAERGR